MTALGAARSVSTSATGQLDAGQGALLSAHLAAAGDAATATIRTGGASGTVICKLAAAAGTGDERCFLSGVPFSDLHVTVTGTSPTIDVELL